MHRIALTILILGIALQSSAEPLRPFIGGSFGITNTDDSFLLTRNSENFFGVKLPSHGGLDWQAEIGVTNDTYSGYLGYRTGSSSLSGDEVETYNGAFFGLSAANFPPDFQFLVTDPWVTTTVTKSELEAEHFVIGGRAQLKLGLPEIIRPMIGVGLTYGKVKRTLTYTLSESDIFMDVFPELNEDTEFNEVSESDDAYGGLFEAGFALRPNLPFQVYAVFQLHVYEAELKGPENSPTAWQHEIREHAFVQLGIMYHFKSFGNDE